MRTLLPSLATMLLTLAACSPSSPPSPDHADKAVAAVDASLPTQADLERFLAEGPDPTLRTLSMTDYWLHYKVMQASGIERELGGEAQAIAALQALGNAYERKLRGAEADVPKMIPAAFTGEGMSSGFMGMGMGGFLGMMTGGMLSGSVGSMSDERLAELVKAGPIKFDGGGGNAELHFSEDGSLSQSMEFEVNEHGLNGKVKLKTQMDACPDAQGKVTVTLETDSQMTVKGKPGTGGSVHSEFKYERYLDDDAHLIDSGDGGASNLRIKMGGSENFQSQQVDITTGHTRSGEVIFENHGESGFSIFRMEEVENTKKLLQGAEFLQTLIAEAMLRGMGSSAGSPWEGGRCIDLKVTSDPAKRKGIRPNTAFDLEASPRVKADGAPAHGTVVATLSGGSALQPASGKVPADAKYQYAGPDKKDQVASIAFEARSKRGVGRATLDFDTRQGGYRITGGKCAESYTVCDISKPFTGKACGATYTHTPTSDKGGTYSFRFEGGGGAASSSGTYTLSGPEEKLTATHSGSRVCMTAGLTRCFTYPAVIGTWTKIDSCDE